ncbi:MAG: hypothetical protein ACQGQO_07675 [Sphaerochaetaceae bacterium]|jgi:hypothetical protein
MTPEEAQRLAEVEKKAACTEIIANKNEGDCQQLWLLWKLEMQERRLGLQSSRFRSRTWMAVISVAVTVLMACIKAMLGI